MKKLITVLVVVLLTCFIFSNVMANDDEKIKKHPGYVDFDKIKIPKDAEESVEVYVRGPLLKLVAAVTEKEDPALSKMLEKMLLIRVNTFSIDDKMAQDLKTKVDAIAAWNIELGYTFNAATREITVAAGYQGSDDAADLIQDIQELDEEKERQAGEDGQQEPGGIVEQPGGGERGDDPRPVAEAAKGAAALGEPGQRGGEPEDGGDDDGQHRLPAPREAAPERSDGAAQRPVTHSAAMASSPSSASPASERW